ncbi:sigma-70 family RNA polymerase sigma factor [Branchiibius sp. NY16-3462-2]|uniref:RNA polymerase sigma factor n=1 Tax=Branchiibius sp. NY16-3462-2 TaxID=1807500 RepID=UPI000798FC72|nr:sigma-70 family RNA polymerase sigma factor [Branchiibius sp. NY16-3462-2]KYH44954.1 RNA polymerase subunit sigma-24 [Branchiibius sp. NY16-3462-2]
MAALWLADGVPPEGDSRADAELSARLASGDPDALAEMFQRWGTLVHTIARRALDDAHDAEDVTQQVFLAAWRSRHTLVPGHGSPAAWLVAITKHRIADVRQQRQRARRNLDAAILDASAPPVGDADLADQIFVVHELEQLGDPRAAILRLAIIEDRPYAEISEHLGIPLGTVKSHVRRGLVELRRRLKESGDGAP